MTKRRKITFVECLEIVKDYLGNIKNYQATAEKFKVSYQQVYQWVKKYEDKGEKGLQDLRDRTKPEEELTAEDQLKLEIQRIERENERLRAENLYLKKLEEIERRGR
ncbi:transposase [Solibacillus silvestris StLB046]|uniref:Transposase n=1 Tax=Solibacillus silvestris (strain StLB046) TaxID=1002809 RepID=F2F0U5_SOLSS|nr:helix-turn-helix domain-containing protein [Solibacillus silvestris]BAK16339.1 transposase [Solibacillus silvestris StLB046]